MVAEQPRRSGGETLKEMLDLVRGELGLDPLISRGSCDVERGVRASGIEQVDPVD